MLQGERYGCEIATSLALASMAKAVREIRTDFILLEDRQLVFDTGSCALPPIRHVQVAGVAGR